MRLVLYNVRYATGTGWRFHLPFPFAGFFRRTDRRMRVLQNYIQTLTPDIVGLVEVDAGSYRSRRRCQATLMAQTLGRQAACRQKYGMKSLVSRCPVLRRQANAWLSADAAQSARFHYFHSGVKRLVIELRLAHISIFLVHLALSRRTRSKQLEQLAGIIRTNDRPCIVAGDFNAFAGIEELHTFMTDLNLASANGKNEPTYPAHAPRWQLDYILHSPEIHINQFQIPRDVHLSDHLPLICDFEFINETAEEDYPIAAGQ